MIRMKVKTAGATSKNCSRSCANTTSSIRRHRSSASSRKRASFRKWINSMTRKTTRSKTHLRLLLARSRMLWGETRANAGSRFIDDLPESVTERRSDDILSAFAWASKKMISEESRKSSLQPFRQEEVSVEFNQDLSFTSENDNQDAFDIGNRDS